MLTQVKMSRARTFFFPQVNNNIKAGNLKVFQGFYFSFLSFDLFFSRTNFPLFYVQAVNGKSGLIKFTSLLQLSGVKIKK